MDLLNWARSQWDRTGALLASIGGMVAILLGYLGVSATRDPGKQIPFIVSGAVFGLYLLGLAATLWLSADLRDEWRKLDEIDERLAEVSSQANACR